MKSLLKTILLVILIVLPFLNIQSKEIKDKNDKDHKIKAIAWHDFEWLPEEDYGSYETPHGILRFNPGIEGLTGKGFQLSLDVRDSYIYETGLDFLLWRKPGIEEKIIDLQAAGQARTRELQEAEISLNNNFLGYLNLRVIEERSMPEEVDIEGFIGHGFFRTLRKILVIDYPGTRLTVIDTLPDKWKEKAHLIDMESSIHYLSLDLTANGRRITLGFDPTSKPGLILYRNRHFRRIASEEHSHNTLRYYSPGRYESLMIEGKTPQSDIYFGPYKLRSHDIYLMDERGHRRGYDNGLITQPFFLDYIMIIDYKNNQFGILPSDVINN